MSAVVVGTVAAREDGKSLTTATTLGWGVVQRDYIDLHCQSSEKTYLHSDLVAPARRPPFDQSSDVTGHIETVLHRFRAKRIRIPQAGDVRKYLLRFSDVAAVLDLVSEAAYNRFGPDAQLSLEVYHDPEIDDEYLALFVRQREYDANVMENIKRIRASYEELLSAKSGWLLLTTDFRPPA